MKQIIYLVVRHALTTVGGGLALGGDDVQTVAGAAAIVAGLLLSFFDKRNRK